MYIQTILQLFMLLIYIFPGSNLIIKSVSKACIVAIMISHIYDLPMQLAYMFAAIGDFCLEYERHGSFIVGVKAFNIFHLILINYMLNMEFSNILVFAVAVGIIQSFIYLQNNSYKFQNIYTILALLTYACNILAGLYISLGTTYITFYCIFVLSDIGVMLQILLPGISLYIQCITLPLYWISMIVLANTVNNVDRF